MNQSKLLLVPVFFLTFAINLFSQSVELKYRERTIGSDLSIQIYFSDESGNEYASPDSIANSANFYFCFKPIGEWTFSQKNINGYVDPIILKQNDSTINYLSRNPIREGKSIIKFVLSYKKNDLDYLGDFNFENKLENTELMNISEEYWPIFNQYKPVFTQGRETFKLQEYLMAFQILKIF